VNEEALAHWGKKKKKETKTVVPLDLCGKNIRNKCMIFSRLRGSKALHIM
jgi:predicted aconitase with swiveling domain